MLTHFSMAAPSGLCAQRSWKRTESWLAVTSGPYLRRTRKAILSTDRDQSGADIWFVDVSCLRARSLMPDVDSFVLWGFKASISLDSREMSVELDITLSTEPSDCDAAA